MRVLFVDGCIRGAQSRTRLLAQTFLDTLTASKPDCTVETADLNTLRLVPLFGDTLAERDAAVAKQDWTSPWFTQAVQFQQADLVVIAAPFWEGTFPAVLHTYIEHICAAGLTFKYAEDGSQIGLCRAEHAVFFGTKGGIYSQGPAREDDFAARFLRTNLSMLGIPKLDVVEAEGLDIDGADVTAILENAKRQARALAEQL